MKRPKEMFKYETHCHTSPVSKCGKATVEDTVSFYRRYGYDGIFITNHFLDGNINPEARGFTYCDQIDYYFSDYEDAVKIGSDVGIKVFPRSVHGVEVINSNQAWESNEMAELYAGQYGFLRTAGSDNHWGSNAFERLREKGFRPEIAGMCSDTEINSVQDFIDAVRTRTMNLFLMDETGNIKMDKER